MIVLSTDLKLLKTDNKMNISRRNFLCNSLLAGASIMATPANLLASLPSPTPQNFDSQTQGLLPFVIFSDVSFLLSLRNHNYHPVLNAVFRVDLDKPLADHKLQLAAVLQPQKESLKAQLIELKAQNANDNSYDAAFLKSKSAFITGCIMKFHIDKIFGAYYHKKAKNDKNTLSKISLYHDAFLLQLMTTGTDTTSDDISILLQAMFPRMIGRIHTLKPDPSDAENWVVRMTNWRKANKNYLKTLATTIIKPDSKLYAEYITDAGFYNENDPIIVGLQGNDKISKGDNKSLYGRALNASYEAILRFDKFLNNTLEVENILD